MKSFWFLQKLNCIKDNFNKWLVFKTLSIYETLQKLSKALSQFSINQFYPSNLHHSTPLLCSNLHLHEHLEAYKFIFCRKFNYTSNKNEISSRAHALASEQKVTFVSSFQSMLNFIIYDRLFCRLFNYSSRNFYFIS